MASKKVTPESPKAEKPVKAQKTTKVAAPKAEKAQSAPSESAAPVTAPVKKAKVTFSLPKEAVENAEQVAVLGDFNNWQEGWLDWNLVLDETGGPNHVGNFCDAPIIADTVNQELFINISYYYIGHFSRFVKPGAVRIGVDAEKSTSIQHVAFANKEGGIVLIAMNESEDDISFNAELDGKYARHTLPAHSIVTMLLDK